MKNSIILLLIFSNCVLAQGGYEAKIISSGRNMPDFNSVKDSVIQFIVSLHKKQSPQDFQQSHRWTGERYRQMTEFLISKNFVKRIGTIISLIWKMFTKAKRHSEFTVTRGLFV